MGTEGNILYSLYISDSDGTCTELLTEVSSAASNSVLADTHRHLCVQELFEAQVKQSPDAVALIFENTQITYQQLNQQANQLAHFLQTLGVGPEVLVGVFLERSPTMIISLLAVLKAGGGYVPLDPSYPSDRLAFILQDTQLPVILTQLPLQPQLPAHTATVVCLDTDWTHIAQFRSDNPECKTQPHNLIYTIYTSGSTGKPKGVMMPHAGICNQLRWRQDTFPLDPTDSVLQNISFSFDPSVWQIFWPLSVGAKLVLPRPNGQQDIPYLINLISLQQVTVIALVPSLLRVLLEAKDLNRCSSLRHVFCGGEALALDLQTRFFERFSAETALHNVYGPTEAAIDATHWLCQRGNSHPVAPIGRPIHNAQIYILDETLQQLPMGEAGELYIGGAGLARGYLNRPELTAEKFVAHPYDSEPGSRLYRTGDLARYLPDNTLEFLGRIDYQVKIRGFRIELEEIEAILNQHPQVQQSIVVAREDIPGDKRLFAYWIPSQQPTPSAEALRSWLQAKLPEYMVPAMFIMLTEFPLNPNGKVDRRALPAPGSVHLSTPSFIAPRNETEQSLAAVWAKILNIQAVSATDNFFELGGNSLLAASLFAEIEQLWGWELPVSVLFEAPTLEQLATILQAQTKPQEVRSLVKIQAGRAKPPLFCLHTRTGHIFEYYGLAKYLDPDQPVYGLQAPLVDGKPLQQPLEQMAADYIQAIQSIQPNGPYFLCGYSFGGLLAYEIARQLAAKNQSIALLVLADTYNTAQTWFRPIPVPARIVRHLRNLQSLTTKRRLAYLRNKTKNKVRNKVEANAVNTQHFEKIAQDYRPLPYDGKAILFKASYQPTQRGIESNLTDALLGWGDLIKGGLEVQSFSCDHFSLFKEPMLPSVATKLRAYLPVS